MTNLPDEINISWHFTDVQEQDDTLTNDEARQILQLMQRNHDANIGINRDVIDEWIRYFKTI